MEQELSKEWQENNQAFQKRKKRQNLMTVLAAVGVIIAAVVVIVYCLDADKRAYIEGLDSYYEGLRSGTDEDTRYSEQEVTQGGKAFLDGQGYSSVADWYHAIQRYEIEQLNQKYGEGFTVQYRILKTEELTEEEIKELHDKAISSVGYAKAYRLTVKEHFSGSKADGYEEQTIVAIKNEENGWQYNIQRWTEYARSGVV